MGQRILQGVKATRTVVACNTNLGILLMSAPLVQALLNPGGACDKSAAPILIQSTDELQAAVWNVLAATTVPDAVDAYAAIRLAEPGGLGKVSQADVAEDPGVTLTTAMAYARRRDLLAAQYANGYRLVFSEALPLLLALYQRWGYNNRWPVAGIYMALLAKHPDSLVVRKRSAAQADVIKKRAASLASKLLAAEKPWQLREDLLDLDCRFKSDGINPGTTADLVVVSVFIAKLIKDLNWLNSQSWRREVKACRRLRQLPCTDT